TASYPLPVGARQTLTAAPPPSRHLNCVAWDDFAEASDWKGATQMQTMKAKGVAAHVTRRRLLTAAAATGVCAAGALAAPRLVPLAEQELQHVALGELKQLEGVSLDAAIEAAEITRAAVQVIVLPVARLMTLLGG